MASDEYTQGSGTTLDFQLDSTDDAYTQGSGTTLDFDLQTVTQASGTTTSLSLTSTTASGTEAKTVSSTTTTLSLSSEQSSVDLIIDSSDTSLSLTSNAASVSAQANASGVATSLSLTSEQAAVDAEIATIDTDLSLSSEQAELVVDPIEVISEPATIQMTSYKLSDGFVSPDTQDALSPVLLLSNQTDDTAYDVYFYWSSSLDSCLEIGISDEPETSFGNTSTTGTSDTFLTRIQAQGKNGLWMYGDINNCGFGTSFDEEWNIDAIPVAEASTTGIALNSSDAQVTTT